MDCCKDPKAKAFEAKFRGRTKCPEPPKVGYYSYSVNTKTSHGRPKYRNDPNRPKGVHDFYNLMWDPHVYRGETFKTFQTVELERKRVIEKGERKKKFKKQPRRLGGIEIPQTPPPAEGHERNIVATDKFLEEFSVPVEEVDATTQTDIIDEIPPPTVYVPVKAGYDVATEIFPEELYHFEEEVTPIVDTLSWKVMEQALLEFTEEEELRLLTSEQNQYEERRRLEAVRVKRLAEREQQMHAERAALMGLMIQQMGEEKESEERVGAFLFSCSYLKELLPQCLESLSDEGFLHNQGLAEITDVFMPWLDSEVRHEIGQKLMARAITDEIIHNTSAVRQEEYNSGAYRDPILDSFYELHPEDYGE